MVIGKADVWLLSASVCSFNDLLSEIASRLATFDLVPKEDHMPGRDDLGDVHLSDSCHHETTHVGLGNVDNLVDLFSVRGFLRSHINDNVSK